jgi:1,4-alpha-glucan branching enzyme
MWVASNNEQQMKRKEVRMARKNQTRQQTFSFTAPAALSVQLVGDFTQWEQHPINLRKAADGIWRATVGLEPGEHHYRFLVDGHWRDDPESVWRVQNPFGSQNSVRQVV